MKRHYVIEADTEMFSLFVREVTQDFDEHGIVYTCKAYADIAIYETPGPKFYGMLDVLLVTKGKIRDAQPITPEPQEVQS